MTPPTDSSAHTEGKQELPGSLRSIIAAIESADELTPKAVRRIVTEAEIDPQELMPWSAFDHSPADSYGRRLVYDGGFFEMMVMSWCPGDMSAIHDHGHTRWGAVQIFGPAEHAVFMVQNGEIRTLSRSRVKPGQVIYVGHDLVHQMGNRNDTPGFLSFHLYGCSGCNHGITQDARLFDLNEGSIQRVDWGVFQALPEHDIKRREKAPEPDFPTWLRNTVELVRRLRIARAHGVDESGRDYDRLIDELFDRSGRRRARLLEDLRERVDEHGHALDGMFWKLLCQELSEAAELQDELLGTGPNQDTFSSYAERYDAVIGRPCLDAFIAGYLGFCRQRYNLDFGRSTLLSLGCGTGLTEAFMITEFGVKPENLLGIDLSDAMIEVARRRINARKGDLRQLDRSIGQWNVAFGGLNVLQYLPHDDFEAAVRSVANALNPGGFFVGDFITSDHIRWYPNLVGSNDRSILSFRTPALIEKAHYMYQSSRILNVDFRDGMRITNEGTHERFLPPLSRVRQVFETAFNSAVDIYDAVSLQPIAVHVDTCPSTRYLVCAQKQPR